MIIFSTYTSMLDMGIKASFDLKISIVACVLKNIANGVICKYWITWALICYITGASFLFYSPKTNFFSIFYSKQFFISTIPMLFNKLKILKPKLTLLFCKSVFISLLSKY